jgi:hypothetical protein
MPLMLKTARYNDGAHTYVALRDHCFKTLLMDRG